MGGTQMHFILQLEKVGLNVSSQPDLQWEVVVKAEVVQVPRLL